ncbi:hypothetical protein AVEN_63948-1 [Araneus ventricosus]|uniref:Uncharacterized protein n=1 Tax=Araneus ventricosus TaxID=182803 RepID=A0A4Y2M681_ARAVE|nr:hypothetical protein AVEN_63948-1 [Araneus ventricosus]
MKNVGKVRLPLSKAEIRSKFSKSCHRFLEENSSRRHLPIQVNTNDYIIETPMSNSYRQLPMKQYFLQKREMSHFSRSTTTQIDGSRTTFRDGKNRHQKRTGPNPSFNVAGRRRLLQLMKFDV